MKIVFTGGGTAGHILPILAICREIRRIYSKPDLRLYYIGPKNKYELELLAQEEVRIKRILSGKLRRYFSLKNFLDIFKVPLGTLQAFFWLFFLAPNLVFSKGGYGSLPTVLAAKILAIPIFLHESDVVPGLASKIQSKWALEIFVSFPKTEFFPKDKRIRVGNPIRREILAGSKEKAKDTFNLQGGKSLILILGGSQGAQVINETILEILPELAENFEIIHQTGEKNFKEVKAEGEAILFKKDLKKYYHPFPFLDESSLRDALAVSDLIISRAGAGSIFEIAAVQKPVILIPLENAAQDHQSKNAYQFKEWGRGEVIDQKNLKPHFLLEKLKHLFSRPDILKEMAENSGDFARPKAAKIIASYIIEYLTAVITKK